MRIGARTRRTRPARSPVAPAGREDTGRGASRRQSDRALISLAEAATVGLTRQHVLDLVVAAAATLTREAVVDLWLVGDDGGELRLAAQSGGRPGRRGIPRPTVFKMDEGLAGTIAQRREPVVVSDVRRDRRLASRTWARDQGLVSFAGVPLTRADRLLGVLCLFTRRRYRFTLGEVDLLRSFAAHAAVAVENAALFDAATSRLRRLAALREIEQEISQQRDPEALLALISRRATELLEADSASVFLLDQATGVLRAHASFNIGEWIREVAIPIGQGIVGTVAARHQGMIVNDYPRSAYAISPFRERDRALVAQPLLLGSTLHGVILVRRAAAERPFSQEDLDRLGDFAVQASIALENARLLRLSSARADRVKAAAEVGQLLASTRDADRILDLIAEKTREIVGAEGFGLFRFEPSGRLRYARGFGLPEEFMREHTLAVGEGVVGRAAAERRVVETTGLLRDPAITLSRAARARVEREGSRAIVAAPILSRDTVLGVFAVYHPVGFRIPTEEAEFLETLASHAAAALENARLFEEARQREGEAKALFEVGRLISGTLDPERVLALIVEKAIELVRVRACGIFRLDDDAVLRYARGAGLSATFVRGLAVRLGEGTSGRAVAERAPVWTADLLDDAAIALSAESQRLVEEEGYRAVLSVPILIQGAPFGCLATYWWEAHVPTPGEIETLSSLATLAAVAIENTRLYGETRQYVQRLEGLNQVNRMVSASLRLDQVLGQIAQAAGSFFGASLATLWMADEDRRILTRRAGYGEPGLLAHVPTRLGYGEAGAGWVAEHREPLVDVPVREDTRIAARELVVRHGIESFSAFPVLLGDRLLGVLTMGRGARRPLSGAELTLVQTLLGQAAIAIENARLYEEATQAYQDLKTAQDQLVRTEKLRALGEMASGVAHDFNNLLAAILGRVQLIQRKVEDPLLRRWLGVVEQAALDGAQTVRHIQEFTRVRRDQPAQTVDLNQVVHDAVEMTRPRWRTEPQSRGLDLRVEVKLGPVPPVEGHPAELREALTNLLLNAVDAMPEGGTITIATRLDGDRVEVAVGDTGLGMPESVRRRIFEPFFSTKGPKGTGLGLAMVYGIVSRHGGEIAVESREGAGSTFTIRLSVGREGPPATAPPAKLSSDAAIRVLVIDDEEEVRETLAEALRVQRHEVVVAEHGAAGVERFRVDAFDLVMTDLGMPGMSGWQVAQTVKSLRPDVPVVLVTGWGVEVPTEQLRASGVDRVMTKPFRLEDVREVVSSLRKP